MIKNIIIAYCCILFTVACLGPKNIIGQYETKKPNIMPEYRLILNEDSSYKYYQISTRYGDYNFTGKWNVIKDTIKLIQYPYEFDVNDIRKYKIFNSYTLNRIQFFSLEDSMSIPSLEVYVNNDTNNIYYTNLEGIIDRYNSDMTNILILDSQKRGVYSIVLDNENIKSNYSIYLPKEIFDNQHLYQDYTEWKITRKGIIPYGKVYLDSLYLERFLLIKKR